MSAAVASTEQSTQSPTLTIEQIQSAMTRGLAKAAAEHLVCYRDGAGYLVPSASDASVEYSVVRCGHQWFSWSCNCQAGQHGRICKHASLAVFCTKYHVHARRPEAATYPLVKIEDLRVARNAALASCRDCDQPAAPGFTLCDSCAASRNRIWDEQDAEYNLPLSRTR